MIVSLADLKTHLNLTTNDDDALLASKLAAAEAWVLAYTGQLIDDDNPASEPVKEGIRQLAAHLYLNREAVLVTENSAVSLEIPFGLEALLTPFRNWSF